MDSWEDPRKDGSEQFSKVCIMNNHANKSSLCVGPGQLTYQSKTQNHKQLHEANIDHESGFAYRWVSHGCAPAMCLYQALGVGSYLTKFALSNTWTFDLALLRTAPKESHSANLDHVGSGTRIAGLWGSDMHLDKVIGPE